LAPVLSGSAPLSGGNGSVIVSEESMPRCGRRKH
jgi:hypothetical protein